MFPLDSEFLQVYLFYLLLLVFILVRLIRTKGRQLYLIHLTILIIYTCFWGLEFSDSENFTGGGSLVMLVYSGLTVLAHLVVFGIQEVVIEIRRGNHKS